MPVLPAMLRQRFANCAEQGNVTMIFAMFAPIAAIMAAFAIDAGMMSSQKRELQGLADIAAIAAAGDLENARTIAVTTLADNGFGGIDRESDDGEVEWRAGRKLRRQVMVETGRYSPDLKTRYDQRFVSGVAPANAVRVTIEEGTSKYFAFFSPDTTSMKATGIAAVSSEAAISVGSRLLSLDEGLLNSLLGGLTGSQVKLTGMDYNGLADADVDLLMVFEDLATRLDLDAVTYDDVLDFDVSLADFALAMANASGGSVKAKAALERFSRTSGLADITVPLSALFDLGSVGHVELGRPARGLDLTAGALQMLTAGTAVANGVNQVDLDLGVDLPALANVKAALLVGERPQSTTWYSLSEQKRSLVSTTQARLFVEANVQGTSLLKKDLLRLPLYIDVTSAEAKVANVICRSGKAEPHRIDVDVLPGLLTLRIADLKGGMTGMGGVQQFEPAEILTTDLISIRASAHSSFQTSETQTLRYYPSDVGSSKPKTAALRDGLDETIESAVRDLVFQIDIGSLSVSSPRLLEGLVGHILSEAAAPLDRALFSLTSALGIGLAEADVWVHEARCNRSVLVQ